MATVLNTLYPPSVATYMPAFIYNQSAFLYFSPSSFNSMTEIEYIHLSLADQRTNENVLGASYSTDNTNVERKISLPVVIYKVWDDISYPEKRELEVNCNLYDKNTGLFKIEIPTSILRTDSGNFNIGQYYKAQIRFDNGKGVEETFDPSLYYNFEDNVDKEVNYGLKQINNMENYLSLLNDYLIQKSVYFSEWSQVCLLRPILIPVVQLTSNQIDGIFIPLSKEDLAATSDKRDSLPVFSKGNIEINGSIIFATKINDDGEVLVKEEGLLNLNDETLDNYSIEIVDKNGNIYYTSDVEYTSTKTATNAINQFNKLITLEGIDEIKVGNTYFIHINATTSNGYKIEKSFFQFKIDEFTTQPEMSFDFIQDEENGLLTINFLIENIGNNINRNGVLYVRRSDNHSNFKKWDLIRKYKIYMNDYVDDKILFSNESYTFNDSVTIKPKKEPIIDNTVCSMTWYRYSFQFYPENGSPLTPIISKKVKQIQGKRNVNNLLDTTINHNYSTDIHGHDGRKSDDDIKTFWTKNNTDEPVEDEPVEDEPVEDEPVEDEPVEDKTQYINFEHAIFSRLDKQLKVNFDFQISSYKPVVNRSKTDTLGGKYPKFTENANLNYKQFSISGKISSQSDEKELFIKKKEAFNDEAYIDYYENINGNTKNISGSSSWLEYNDWLWERMFRDECINWLNDGEPKLLRTLTEGNMCVMLTDISLTPEKNLYRRLYNFSATVYEVGDGNDLDTLQRLGIFEVKDETEVDIDKIIANALNNSFLQNEEELSKYSMNRSLGNLSNFNLSDEKWFDTGIYGSTNGKINILAYIQRIKSYELIGTPYEIPHSADNNVSNLWLKNVKIEFRNYPHCYQKDSNGKLKLVEPNKDSNNLLIGYRINVTFSNGDEQEIFINRRGYYQFPSNVIISKLYFPDIDGADGIRDMIDLNYEVFYHTKQKDDTIITRMENMGNIVGQYSGIFTNGMRIRDEISLEHYYTHSSNQIGKSYVEELKYWKGFSIETEPYTVIEITQWDEENQKPSEETIEFIVGQSGTFNLFNHFPIYDIKFIGRKMRKTSDKHPRENEYNSLTDNEKILIGEKEYDFNKEKSIAYIPINALINYSGTIQRRYF